MLRLSASSFAFTPTQSMPLAGYTRRSGIYDQIDGNLEAVFLRLCDDSGNDVLIGSVDTLFPTDPYPISGTHSAILTHHFCCSRPTLTTLRPLRRTFRCSGAMIQNGIRTLFRHALMRSRN